MPKSFTCFSAAVVVSAAFCVCLAGQDDSKPDLNGKWHLDASKSDMQLNRLSDLTMVINEKDGTINIDEDQMLADGRERKLDYVCTTDGKECEVSGTKAKASFWYNGPMLVSMETQHNGGSVIRQRLKLSQDSKQLTLEISSLVPRSEKTDKLVLNKQ
jgi:hypothetical protein